MAELEGSSPGSTLEKDTPEAMHGQNGTCGSLEKQYQEEEYLSSFPIFEVDWSAYEEIRLLDAVYKYGVGNWEAIAQYVGTKSWVRCQKHYLAVYLESPHAPYADDKSTLLNVEQSRTEVADETSRAQAASKTAEANTTTLSASFASSAAINEEGSQENQRKQAQSHVDSEADTDMGQAGGGNGPTNTTTVDNARSQQSQLPSRESAFAHVQNTTECGKYMIDTSKGGNLEGGEACIYIEEGDELNQGDEVVDRDGNVVGPVTSDIQGYMPLRDDFDVEHDNDAEAVIADMEFHEGEHPTETQLKLKILEIYNGKLDERERRKQFVKERGLLDYKRQLIAEKRKPRYERDIRNQFRPFARFLPPDEWEDLVQGFVAEKRLRKRIEQLQNYRSLGIRTLAEAEEYESMKKKRDTQIALSKQRERDSYLYDRTSTPAKRERPSASSSRTPRATSDNEESAKADESSEDDTITPIRTNEGLGRGRSATRARGARGGQTRGGRGRGRGQVRNRNRGRGGTGSPSSKLAADDDDEDEEGDTADENMEDEDDTTHGGQPSSLEDVPGIDKLSEKEQELCRHLQILPSQYIAIRDAIVEASLKKGYLKRDAAGNLSEGDRRSTEQIYDLCVSCGWVNADANNLSAPPSTPYNSSSKEDSANIS
eukprot:gb/GECG01005959.1/.p1 GENE.gb/GECG01005959.1/~~gb/GECG01005959.1/.p1  ORF type:complete len:656 (+),score=124.19 gb/GECG01005959.1/:1-1968(+)